VLARAPFQGTPRLLPDNIAWRYRSARPRPVGPAGTKRVVVADVEPPVSLELPRLANWSSSGEVVAGPAATPSRVLAAIGDANEVVVHAHGIVDQMDASYIALSTDAAGHFALTTRDVGATRFHTSPLIVLAACRASQGALILHAPWSLPAAFVKAGARAVVASPSPIPDGDAAAFFDDFDRRVQGGIDAAVALRDARVAWLGQSRGDWVKDLIVFE
jgi:CHAT domain-containing protein